MWIDLEPEEVEKRGLEYVRERIAGYTELNSNPDAAAYRAAAPQMDGEVETDEDAVISISDDGGAYVMTWSWVGSEDAGLTEPCPHCFSQVRKGEASEGGYCAECTKLLEQSAEGVL